MLNSDHQLGSTFHGHMAFQLTITHVWISNNGMVITINPGISDPVWGSSDGYTYMSYRGTERRAMVLNIIFNFI